MPRVVALAPVRESSRLCVLAARRLHVEKLKMSGRERTLVTLLIGHHSETFPEPDANGHVFRWTCFVRPVAPHKFTDRSFIKTVKFTLHTSYKSPVRTIKQPPFEVSETGYGSFPPQIEIFFNYPGAKPMKYTYDMLVTLAEPTGFNQQEIVFELKDCPPAFVEMAKKYGAKRKRSAEKDKTTDSLFPPPKIQKLEDDRSSRESSKAPKDKKKEKKEKAIVKEKPKEDKDKKKKKEKKEKREEKKEVPAKAEKKQREKTKSPVEQEKKSCLDAVKASGSGQASPRLPVTPQRPLKLAPNKTDERKPPVDSDSSSPSTSYGSLTPPPPLQLSSTEMQKRIAALSDEDQIYRVAALLLSHPGSSILPSKGVLSFDLDLSTADPSLVARLNEALAS